MMAVMNRNDVNRKTWYLLILMPIIYLAVSVLVVFLVKNNGAYPTGSDTMYHIFRGDYVYNSIKEGSWYPIYNSMWYNGVEIMRYWAPLTAYYMALCQMIAGGGQLAGYLIFVGSVCFLNSILWLIIGRKMNRPYLGAFVGLIWFFMPNNLLALFVEGNLARSLCMIFLPVFIYAVCEYLSERKRIYIPIIIVTFALMAMCHLGYAGMIALAVLIYCIVYMFQQGNKRAVLEVIVSILLGFMVLGIWLVASLNGGITSLDNSENMANFFQKLVVTLNPLDRIKSNNSHFYYGLAACIIAVCGIFLGYKKSRAGFVTAVVILVCTTTAMYPVLSLLPGSQYLWMLRFISIALCFILYSFLKWDTLKKPLVLLMCVLLIADIVPSLTLITGGSLFTEDNKISLSGMFSRYNSTSEDNSSDTSLIDDILSLNMTDTSEAEDRINHTQNYTLISKAQSITGQRLALMDASSLGAMGAWLTADWNNGVPAAFGAGWEAANTSTNIANLNKAMAESRFYYMFDRCEELGNDTVVVRLSQLNKYTGTLDKLDEAANAVGYKLVDYNGDYRLYHLDVNGNWGTISTYEAIGIGSGASGISLRFPAVEETDSYNLDDYTFEQLSQYKEIFLDGFTYNDKEAAEELIIRLSEAGVKIIISADSIPQDKRTHTQTFLGVTCNAVKFENGYPEMNTRIGRVYTDMFPQGHTEWNTVYLDGLDTSYGSVDDNGLSLDFYGTVKNDNIIMCGLGIMNFYSMTGDKTVGRLLENISGLTQETLPQRKIFPLTIDYTGSTITITSNEDNVNTALAYHDIFSTVQNIEKKNNLMYIQKGTTVINIKVPYVWQGAIVSIAGIILSVVWVIALGKTGKSGKNKNENI
jgi:uncharacterized membrane protein